MHNPVLTMLLRLGASMRQKRMALLREHFNFEHAVQVLDVGGSGDWSWDQLGAQVHVTTINLYPPHEIDLPNYVQGDACSMTMFADREFDLVFSNSVIEHLGSREDQQRMASEIRRVGKAYWVQTPNRHFPLELHLCLPFIQYLPVRWRMAVARVWPFSFEKMRGRTEGAVADAQAILLSKREFARLFPGSELICERCCGLAKSLIVFGTNDGK